MNTMNPAFGDPIRNTSAFAGMLSAACASPLVDKTAGICGSYAPAVTMQKTLGVLIDLYAYPSAFELILAWMNLTDRKIPEVLSGIDPESALAASFASEFLYDLDDILDPDPEDDEEAEMPDDD